MDLGHECLDCGGTMKVVKSHRTQKGKKHNVKKYVCTTPGCDYTETIHGDTGHDRVLIQETTRVSKTQKVKEPLTLELEQEENEI